MDEGHPKAGPAPHAGECASVVQTVPLTSNTNALLVGPSMKRRGLVLFGPPTAGQNYFSNQPMTAAQQGFCINNTQSYVYLCKYLHGDVVNKPWYVWSTVNFPAFIIEVMEP